LKADHNSSAEDAPHPSPPFYGYYFRVIVGPKELKTAAGANQREFVFLAYPAEYRSSGVLTFAAGPNGAVYEADLGAATEKTAEHMTEWTRTSDWRAAR
jgi:hypothetical protein